MRATVMVGVLAALSVLLASGAILQRQTVRAERLELHEKTTANRTRMGLPPQRSEPGDWEGYLTAGAIAFGVIGGLLVVVFVVLLALGLMKDHRATEGSITASDNRRPDRDEA